MACYASSRSTWTERVSSNVAYATCQVFHDVVLGDSSVGGGGGGGGMGALCDKQTTHKRG